MSSETSARSAESRKQELALSLRVVSESYEFAALKDEWDSLAAECPDCDFFVTWTWVHAWWEKFGRDFELRIYTVRDQDGQLRGLLPCYLQQQRIVFGMVEFYELRYLGTGIGPQSSYHDLIARPKDRALVTKTIIPHLVSESAVWDVLTLNDMPAESPLTRTLPRDMPGHPFQGKRTPTAIVELPPSWAFYLETLEPDDRANLIACRERFAFEGSVEFGLDTDKSAIRESLATLTDLSQSRGGQSPKSLGDFFNLMSGLLSESKRFRTYTVKQNGTTEAVLVTYHWRDTLYCAEFAASSAVSALDPYRLLVSRAIEDAIAIGASRVDLLGGNLDIKRQLALQTRETVTLGAYRANNKGKLIRLRREFRQRGGQNTSNS